MCACLRPPIAISSFNFLFPSFHVLSTFSFSLPFPLGPYPSEVKAADPEKGVAAAAGVPRSDLDLGNDLREDLRDIQASILVSGGGSADPKQRRRERDLAAEAAAVARRRRRELEEDRKRRRENQEAGDAAAREGKDRLVLVNESFLRISSPHLRLVCLCLPDCRRPARVKECAE